MVSDHDGFWRAYGCICRYIIDNNSIGPDINIISDRYSSQYYSS